MTNSSPAVSRTKYVLVTGGAGFIGCNLADRLAREGEQVLIFDTLTRPGAERNSEWLRRRHPRKISIAVDDIRNEGALRDAASAASAVFHFAAQVAVTASLAEPLTDFSVNLRGTLNLLEALRQRNQGAPLIFASTNKVYGDLAPIPLLLNGNAYQPAAPGLKTTGISEDFPLDFQTPYGCSKGAADQYVLDYARSFGLSAAVIRMSCIYGPRQMGTEDQGWVAHFLLRALRGEPVSVYGDGCQVRDLLFVDDAIEAYVRAWRRIRAISGRAFNLGGGPENAVSLLELIAYIEELLGRRVLTFFQGWRKGDQRYFVADTRRIARALGLPAPIAWRTGVLRLAGWLQGEGLPRGAAPARAGQMAGA
jgi:CDP-paratose 2-epimerase